MKQNLKCILTDLIPLALFLVSLNVHAQIADNIHGGTEGGIVGKIPGKHDVTPNGQFTYEIPISIPSGIGGIEPKLTIAYNSGNGNGLLGYGFDLKGLSVISRAPRNLFNDNISDVIRFDKNDRFTLDGARLQLIKAGNDNREYRTEHNTFSRIIAYGTEEAPSRFVVYSKAGLVYEYEPLTQSTKNLFWPLVKVTDTCGNYYTISYNKYGNNEVVPSHIFYTGNSSTGTSPSNSITFTTTSISRTASYIGGEKYLHNKAIKSISVKYGDELVKQYDISYESKNGKQYLSSVTERTSQEKMNPTVFFWDNNEDHKISKNSYTPSEFKKVNVITGDFNGDGKMDFITKANNNAKDYNFYIYLGAGSGFATPISYQYKLPEKGKYGVRIESIVAGDFNGDGYDDIVIERSSDRFYWLDYMKAKVSGKGSVSFEYQKTIEPPFNLNHRLHVMDANCDGAADLFIVNSNYYLDTYYALVSTYSDDVLSPLNLTAKGKLVNDDWDYPGCMSLLDLDGDGTYEVLNCKEKKSSNGCGSVLYKMSKSGKLTQLTGLTLGGEDHFIIGDFNGDGKSDIITTGNDKSTKWEVNFSTGSNDVGKLFDSYTISTAYFSQKNKLAYGVDVNGDGLCDIVAVDKDNTAPLEVYVNNGTGKSFTKTVNDSVTTAKGWNYRFEDFNGDGKLEALSYPGLGDGTVGFSLYAVTGSSHLLTGITDGLGNTLSIAYSRLSGNDCFTRGTAHEYPVVSVANSWPVVSYVTSPNSVYGNHKVAYRYHNALYHKRGRGMLGFERVTVFDNLTGERKESVYEVNNIVLTPMLRNTSKYMDSVLLETSYSDYVLNFRNGISMPSEWVYTCLPKNTINNRYEFSSKELVSHVTTTNDYDSYGNVTCNRMDYGDRLVTTTNTYINDEKNWLLGRLVKGNVTKSNSKQSTSVTSEFSYDSKTGLLSTEKYAVGTDKGYEKKYEYDPYGNITKDIQTPNDGSLPRIRHTEYTQNGRFLSKSMDCLGYEQIFSIDPRLGVKSSSTDANGISSNYGHNSFGELISIASDLSFTTYTKAWSKGHSYAPQNALYYTKEETRGEDTKWKFYDRLGQLLRIASTAHNPTQIVCQDYQYDAKGQTIAVSEPYYLGSSKITWTTTTYDQVGRTTSVTSPLDATTDYEYNGLTTTVTDPEGNTSSKTYDMLGQLTESRDAAGISVTYEYDVNGNCTKVTGPRTTILSEYDEMGNRTKLTDPDLGVVTNTYDAYGNKLTETTSHGTTSYSYDVAGRLTKETRPDFTYTYTYDTQVKGTLSSMTCSNNTSMEYTYDRYGRKTQCKENIQGKEFVTNTEYDAKFNRVSKTTYPSGLCIGYEYTGSGYLAKVYNNNTHLSFWKVKDVNARGQVTQESLGNGLSVNRSYDSCGRLLTISTPGVNEYTFGYDRNNNLISKEDKVNNLAYFYSYDELGRLTHIYNDGKKQSLFCEMKYDEAGNITYKTGVGNISYKDGTNQIAEISGYNHKLPAWNYIGYTSFDKVSCVKQGTQKVYDMLDLTYGPDKQCKYREVSKWNTRKLSGNIVRPQKIITSLQKYHIGACYEYESGLDKCKETTYIMAGDKLVAFVVKKDTVENTYYVHDDNIGSIVACSKENGQVDNRTICDPWGRRMNSNGSYDNTTVWNKTDRCFTGHEHVGFSLINMGGRMYSPDLGRFLSPDPFIQAPEFSQSLNRYAYCLNNPLSLTDPTGYNWLGDTFCAILGIAVGFDTGGLATGVVGALIGGACGGASSALASCLMNGANLWQTTKSTFVGGFWGAATGIMNCEIGNFSDDFATSCALHSVSDGAVEAMQGGHFEHGFFTGMASAIGNLGIAKYGDHLSLEAQVATSAVLGGTVSVIGGGKFASGAMTSAFQMMYNEQMHRGPSMKDLDAIDKIYRQSMRDLSAKELYESLGFPEYNNACAARMCYALNKSGVLKIPYIKGQTHLGNDGNYYFFFAKDMENWLSSRRVWGNPRIYHYSKTIKLMNGVVSQGPFGGDITGHIEYFYNGHDGQFDYPKDQRHGADYYYHNYENISTKLWKCGYR